MCLLQCSWLKDLMTSLILCLFDKRKSQFYFSFAVIQESIKLRCELKVLEGTFYAKEYYF